MPTPAIILATSSRSGLGTPIVIRGPGSMSSYDTGTLLEALPPPDVEVGDIAIAGFAWTGGTLADLNNLSGDWTPFDDAAVNEIVLGGQFWWRRLDGSAADTCEISVVSGAVSAGNVLFTRMWAFGGCSASDPPHGGEVDTDFDGGTTVDTGGTMVVPAASSLAACLIFAEGAPTWSAFPVSGWSAPHTVQRLFDDTGMLSDGTFRGVDTNLASTDVGTLSTSSSFVRLSVALTPA